ncbi:hypothetical protein DL764_009372 [Monosporascus ibericus]|uniref:Mid2 domain-containing protein n=1 Tax=Monosporascus ibericus TaxID=155417 RepID=A0A4Q4SV56_9PEZI|nr:hypothetical protein DL764_009372 [Monosporascus ibericus]
MRLDAPKIGLFAGLLGAVTGRDVPGRLTLLDFWNPFPEPAVFVKNQSNIAIVWATATNSRLAVTHVHLYQKGNVDGEDDRLIAEGNVPTDFDNDPVGQKEGIDHSERQVSVLRTSTLGDQRNQRYQTIIPVDQTLAYFSEAWNFHVLYVEFDLSNDTHTGQGYSPTFAVIDGDFQRDDANRILTDEENREKEDVLSATPTTHVPTGNSATPTPTPTATSRFPSDDLPTASPAAGGLSTGAIAGIAVGIGIGLLAVAGLSVWFCLRRRQSGRPLVRAREVGYGSDSGAIAMMPEKEAAGLTESSSHPVYDQPSAPVAHHGDPTAAADPYTPYSDHMVAPGTAVTTPTSVNEPSPVVHEQQQQQGPGGEAGAARQHQQQPIASRYAHLVEEGMTEEEIRRLEEEERQLDAAIEQAGQRPSQARQ